MKLIVILMSALLNHGKTKIPMAVSDIFASSLRYLHFRFLSSLLLETSCYFHLSVKTGIIPIRKVWTSGRAVL